MITAEPVLLPDSVSKPLSDWLKRTEMKTLIRVAEAHQKSAEAKVLEPAHKSLTHPLKIESANEHLAEAHRYATFIDVLQKIASQTEFHDVKLS